MILVTSAAGHTGRQIVSYLVEQGLPVIATDINPQVQSLPGIQQGIVGDLTDLSFQKELVKQADQIVYIPPLFTADEAWIGTSLVDAAIQAQVTQFVFISVTHPILTSLLQHVAKRDVEEHLVYQGMHHDMNYTILQPMHYMHNFDPNAVKESGHYRIFYNIDSKVSYVDPRDVAEVVAQVVNDPVKHNKAAYELVGTKPYSPNELVSILNELTSLHTTAEFVPLEEFLDENHMNDVYMRDAVKHLAETYSDWGLDGNPNVLRMLLGREPTGVEDYMKRELKD